MPGLPSWVRRRLGRAAPYFAKFNCGFLPKAATRTNPPGFGILMESSGCEIPHLMELKTRSNYEADLQINKDGFNHLNRTLG
jgi:hypothetical protein